MLKGSDASDVQSNCHIYFPANGETKINCTGFSGYAWVGKGGAGRTFLPLHVVLLCLEGLSVVPVCQRRLDMSQHSASAISIIASMHPCKQPVSVHHASFCFLRAPGLLWLLKPAQGLLVSLLRVARAGLNPMLRAVWCCTLCARLCFSQAAEAHGDKQQLSLLQNK